MFKDNLINDLKDAMKAGEAQKRDTIRGLQSAIKNKEIEKRAPLTEEEMLVAVAKEIKNRKKAIELFKQGGRQDLIDSYTAEIKILEGYAQS